MRINVKGGVWTNVEDEILKVAVMKYGKNQWARISSLLVRKTPKQCKARWYEWLDPSIKKTEWSKEEEEKLLHLAKLMPTQWRTIAPMIGRTPAQCLEHYERLLDAAQAKEREENTATPSNPDGALPSVDEARRLRPGEIDPSPENKPARPDPVDMDEDEKEMLSEARARLANTQGKKAKRKAREKLLEEAKRLASLQKRRELQAAGLPGPLMRHRGMNYNTEIPFERKPVPGFYDTIGELEKEPKGHNNAANKEKQTDEETSSTKTRKGKTFTLTRDAVELAARKKDAQKDKLKQEQGYLSTALEKKLKEQEASRRPALNLPTPQVGETELEQIIKMGQAGERAIMLASEAETPASASLRLSNTAAMTPLRTFRNVLGATPINNAGGKVNDGGNGLIGTPKYSGASYTPKSTPLRDQLNINAEPINVSILLQQQRLNSMFKSLPKPKNDFDIVVPEDDSD